MTDYSRSNETSVVVASPVEIVFSFLDDHRNLAAHMDESSWMMLGSSMKPYFDADRTRLPGSRFGFRGSFLGVPLAVDEVVTRREPPNLKTWETVGEPKLWVIGQYLMGFEIVPSGREALLTVFIRYDLPKTGISWLLGLLLGNVYARWCTSRMASDAASHFKELDARQPLSA